WLYRVATNLCIDQLRRVRRRRELPQGAGAPMRGDDAIPLAGEPSRFIGPFPDALIAEVRGAAQREIDPEARYLSTESIRLAFIGGLQRLAPQQRAVVLLCAVMDWRAGGVAEVLQVSGAAVSSALPRARQAVAREEGRAVLEPRELSAADRELLTR